MTTDEIALRVIEVLNEHEIPYMLVGSLSTNFYSVPRSTQDANVESWCDRHGSRKLLQQIRQGLR